MTRILVLALLAAVRFAPTASAQELSGEHRIILAEAYRLMDHVEDRWAGWQSAPEAILLVDEEFEFLVGHPGPSDDFRLVAQAGVDGRSVFVRERVSQAGLLATYPAVGGVPTIVVGTPQATGLNPTRWILTVVHEHFHQLQMSRPTYYSGVDALGLSGGDESGMWMLDYPFPYDVPSIRQSVTRLGGAAAALARRTRGEPDATEDVDDFLAARADLAEVLNPRDYRYLAFQVWQEGVARYAELDAAEHAARTFQMSERFRTLPAVVSFDEAAEVLWEEIVSGVAQDLSSSERVYFYSLGALEAVLLEAARPGWRSRYTVEPFDVAAYWSTRQFP